MVDVTMRPATAGDAAALTALRASVGWETGSIPGQLAGLVAGQRTLIVAERHGWVVGVVTVEWYDHRRPDLADGATRAHLNDRAVHPTMQRRGLGSQLMGAAEALVAARGYRAAVAQVPASLPHVYSELTRRGYADTGTKEGFAVLVLPVGPAAPTGAAASPTTSEPASESATAP